MEASAAPPSDLMGRACHRCGREIGAVERVGRRDACLGCGSDLHCCRNCTFYDPAFHNQCRETQAERQVDKEQGNFCEYFSFADRSAKSAAQPDSARAALDRLFAGRAPGRDSLSSGDAPPKGRRS